MNKTKVFSAPESCPKPTFDFRNIAESQKRENEWVQKVIKWAKTYGKGTEAGKQIRFSVADGYACYVVVSLNPCHLIHLDVGDGYQQPYIERLTAADIRKEIEMAEVFERFMAKGRKGEL